jgi:putative membrane protein
MLRASDYFSEEERQSISDAIASASRRTSSQLCVVVTSRSGRYERAQDLFGLLVALAAVATAWVALPMFSETWNRAPASPGLAIVLAIFTAGFVGGTMLAIRFPKLARPLVSAKVMEENLRARAMQSFLESNESAENEKPTVLVYVSLFERWVWVAGDREVSRRLDTSVWAKIRDELLEGFKQGNARWALSDAVWRCGEILAEPFPTSEEIRAETSVLHLID